MGGLLISDLKAESVICLAYQAGRVSAGRVSYTNYICAGKMVDGGEGFGADDDGGAGLAEEGDGFFRGGGLSGGQKKGANHGGAAGVANLAMHANNAAPGLLTDKIHGFVELLPVWRGEVEDGDVFVMEVAK